VLCFLNSFREETGLNPENPATQAATDPSVLAEFTEDSFSPFCLV